MANATLVITATLVNGGLTRDSELEQLVRATLLAAAQSRAAGGAVTSGTATAEFASVSASYTYSPVASS